MWSTDEKYKRKHIEIIKGIINEELRKTNGQGNIYVQNLDEDLSRMYKFKYGYGQWFLRERTPEENVPILYVIRCTQFIKGEPAYHLFAYYRKPKYFEHVDILEEHFEQILIKHNYTAIEYADWRRVHTMLGYCPDID